MKFKHQRELERMIAAEGLEIIGEICVTAGNHLQVCCKAPNGKTQKFSMSSTPSDWRADRKRQADFRRFARANPKPAVQLDSAKARAKTPEFKMVKGLAPPPMSLPLSSTVFRTLETTPPQNATIMKKTNATTPPSAPAPSAGPVASAPALPPSAPAPSTGDVAAAPTSTTSGKKERARPVTVARLDAFQTVELADFLRMKYDWVGERPETWDVVADKAATVLGFKVSVSTVQGMAAHYNFSLYAPAKMPADAISILARHIKRLYDGASMKVDADFEAVLRAAQGELPI